ALAGLSGLSDPGLEFDGRGPPGAEIGESRESDREQVLGLLSPSPVPRDEIVRLSGLGVARVNVILAELELAGRVVFTAGGGAALA
ncbi:MAG: hypothetical protein ACKN9P_13440, partial [Phenylobacterium sp.]